MKAQRQGLGVLKGSAAETVQEQQQQQQTQQHQEQEQE